MLRQVVEEEVAPSVIPPRFPSEIPQDYDEMLRRVVEGSDAPVAATCRPYDVPFLAIPSECRVSHLMLEPVWLA